MMRDVDTLIDEALDAEERELLHSIGEEQGFITQVLGIFRGRTGWVSMGMIFGQVVTAVSGAWAAWRFFEAGDTLTALHWGLPATALLMTSVMIKTSLFPTIYTNRLMRELKRIELQIARQHNA
jgi:hypothetical protein